MMTTKENIIATLKSYKTELSKFGVSNIGLFGSYLRNEQTNNSDIDLLIDFEPDKENFDNYMAVYDIFENVFKNQKVEVVTKNGLSKYIGPKILKDVVYAKEPVDYLKHIADECVYIISVRIFIPANVCFHISI